MTARFSTRSELIPDLLSDLLSSHFSAVPIGQAFFRLTAAILLGAIIGFEREWRSKAAGLRTHILVSVAACLFVIIGQEISELDFGGADEQQHDPLRMIEAVTAGVAFLAAGLIFTSKGEVRNVTTGASLWLAGAVGLGCGAGQLALAAMASLMVVTVLSALLWVEGLIGTASATEDDGPVTRSPDP